MFFYLIILALLLELSSFLILLFYSNKLALRNFHGYFYGRCLLLMFSLGLFFLLGLALYDSDITLFLSQVFFALCFWLLLSNKVKQRNE